MLGKLPRFLLTLAACGLLTSAMAAQQTPKVSLDNNETIFTVLTAINACGYDQDLDVSEKVRSDVRAEVAKAIQKSVATGDIVRDICSFYRDHRQQDSARDLAQYVSLAMSLGEPPAFKPTVRESDLPPDASYVLGLVPLLERFYKSADLHQIWLRHIAEYETLIERFHTPVSKMLLATDVYLRIPISGYVGRQFVIYIDPMVAPGQVNSRNYGTDYYMLVSPEQGDIKIDAIRHTYLHFVLDPLAMKRVSTMRRFAPLLTFVKTAPMDESFKTDISLLVTESLIKAIEARQLPGKGKDAEAARENKAEAAAREGFILAPYFFEALTRFEQEPNGLQDAYPNWLHYIDVDKEKKRAEGIQFASQAAPEVLRASKPAEPQLLIQAENRLAAGDTSRAQELAQKALDQKKEDAGRALFILARASTLNKDMLGAKKYFEQTLEVSHEPKLVAWSHIYLGRILDLQENREAALEHYRAALAAGDDNPATKAAAERGLQQPYEPQKPGAERKEERQ